MEFTFSPLHSLTFPCITLAESDDDQLDDEDQGSADSGGEDTNNDNNENSLYGEESSSNNFSTPQQGQVHLRVYLQDFIVIAFPGLMPFTKNKLASFKRIIFQ